MSCKFSGGKIGFSIPTSLKNLELRMSDKSVCEPIQHGFIPETIEQLSISDNPEFNDPGDWLIKPSSLPNSIKRLEIKSFTREMLKPGIIPSSVEYLFSSQRIQNNTLPKEMNHLKSLVLRQSPASLNLPESLTHLDCQLDFPDKNLDLLNLIKLELYYIQVLGKGLVPPTVQHFILHSPLESMHPGSLPPSITRLEFKDPLMCIQQHQSTLFLSLPSLTHLYLNVYNYNLEKIKLPNTLKFLELYTQQFLDPSNSFVWPNKLETLVIQCPFENSFSKWSPFPSSLTLLHLKSTQISI
eukprot:gene5648-7031_t